jgi:hypothetical protein
MDMADGNFMTNQKLLGEKNGSKHADRNDRIVFPPDRPPEVRYISFPTWVHSLPHFSKTSKVYSKYRPTKVEPFGKLSTSISLYD